MANENGKPQAQTIPLAKIHDLPGVFISKQPDKAYGGLVTSIQAGAGGAGHRPRRQSCGSSPLQGCGSFCRA